MIQLKDAEPDEKKIKDVFVDEFRVLDTVKREIAEESQKKSFIDIENIDGDQEGQLHDIRMSMPVVSLVTRLSGGLGTDSNRESLIHLKTLCEDDYNDPINHGVMQTNIDSSLGSAQDYLNQVLMGEVDSDTEMIKKDDDDIDNLKNLEDNDAGMSKATP